MTLQEFLQLLRRNWLLLLAVPLATALSIFFFSRKETGEYASDTTIYTGIASGYNIDKNSASSDYSNNKAYANLLSLINARDTKREVALRLLARYLMLPSYDSAVLSPESYNRLQLLIKQPLRRQLTGASLEGTVRNLNAYLEADNKNVIYKILNSETPNYSLTALSKIVAYQVGNSDLVKIEYVSDDAALCKQTLVDLTQVFIRKHRELQEGQNSSVIGYFGTAAEKARQRLEAAEKNLLAFQRANNIINYDEQSESTAAQKADLEQQTNELEQQYAGAVSALQALKRAAKERSVSGLNNQDTYQLSNQLTKLRTQIADAEVFGRGKKDVNTNATIQKLKEQAEKIEQQMQASISQPATQGQTMQGATSKNLVSDVVRTSLLVEELRAKLLVMRKQRDSFEGEYRKVAPLGVEKRKIERERELAEKEYLSVVNNLDQSQVAQQNIQLTSQLKVVDPPYLAPNRAKSKRLLLLLFGSFGALLLTVGGVTTAALLDPTLRSPELAKARTHLPVFGILPAQADASSAEHTSLFGQAQDQLVRQLLLKMQQKHAPEGPYIVGIASNYTAEGKSIILASLAIRLGTVGLKTLVLLPIGHESLPTTKIDTASYSPLQGISPKTSLTDIVGPLLPQYEVVLVEFPALLEAAYPVALLPYLDLLLVAVRASRSWEAIDQTLFDTIQKTAPVPIELILNGVLKDFAENYLGKQAKPAGKEQPVPVAQEATQWQPQAILRSS